MNGKLFVQFKKLFLKFMMDNIYKKKNYASLCATAKAIDITKVVILFLFIQMFGDVDGYANLFEENVKLCQFFDSVKCKLCSRQMGQLKVAVTHIYFNPR